MRDAGREKRYIPADMMRRICTNCLMLNPIEAERCIHCGGETLHIDEWKKRREIAQPVAAGRRWGPPPNVVAKADMVLTEEPARGAQVVLGMFLSFLAFAIVFIVAYVIYSGS